CTEYHPHTDPNTASVRRMIVSAKHRCHGIGSTLIRAVLAHAEADPASPLKQIELNTSEYQPGAQRLYERNGWGI
ncbi:hypothetical protein B0H10DRAFT_1685111, partial [Mycena sp. CBHHK59/15]